MIRLPTADASGKREDGDSSKPAPAEGDEQAAASSEARESRRSARVVEAVAALARPVAETFGCELDRVEYKQVGRRAVLQVFIDRAGGVTIEDCARVSRQLSAELDVHDVVPGVHDLEVSSPGLDRPLAGEADFRKFAGRPASVTCRRAIAGCGSKVFGRLRGVDGGEVLMETKDGQVRRIPLELVAKARLEPEI